MPETRINKRDIVAIAEKLEEFAKHLPKQEQDVLGWILTRAETAPSVEVAAATAKQMPALEPTTGLRSPLASQLARSVGIGPLRGSDVTVVVGWSYAFREAFEGGEVEDTRR